MKPDQAPTQKETYRPTYLMNTDATALHEIPANPRQQHGKRITHQDQWGPFQQCKGGGLGVGVQHKGRERMKRDKEE